MPFFKSVFTQSPKLGQTRLFWNNIHCYQLRNIIVAIKWRFTHSTGGTSSAWDYGAYSAEHVMSTDR